MISTDKCKKLICVDKWTFPRWCSKYFFFHFYWDIIDRLHYISLRCITKWFGINIYCRMISTVSLVNIHHLIQLLFLFIFLLAMRTFKICSFKSFQIHNTVLWPVTHGQVLEDTGHGSENEFWRPSGIPILMSLVSG